jgi:hypothetical protein
MLHERPVETNLHLFTHLDVLATFKGRRDHFLSQSWDSG